MTIERINIPKYVEDGDKIKDYIHWLDWSLKIEEYVTVRVRSYPKAVSYTHLTLPTKA